MEALYAISPIVVSLAICGLLILGEHRRAAAREEAANAARALNLSFHDDPKGTPVLRGNVEGRRVIAEWSASRSRAPTSAMRSAAPSS